MSPDFLDLLRALLGADARFLVVGAYAVGVHGRAVSSLHRGDGAGVGVGNSWEVENGFGSLAERTVELVREGTHDLRRGGTIIAEQGAQAPGQGANPVTHGYARQHVLL